MLPLFSYCPRCARFQGGDSRHLAASSWYPSQLLSDLKKFRVSSLQHSAIFFCCVPQTATRIATMRCSPEKKPHRRDTQRASTAAMTSSLVLAASSVMSTPDAVLALVDERMSTEGTGLTLGISNNLLAWILLGVFGLIWSLYFVYTSDLDEDEDSGLSL
ncbi:photosystem II reaction center W protein, chloroplastic isoform X2 [Asparagus officinalis]|uniref:photosystem II reaction center W protein, chloroplastic isoform X2 n=1 Tax=Asparagus officinalis TaxID=4686 RepID=UPI00098E0E73|nr:photosystem II reaction center W protein, chloroplastic isoform X2 [Asparagus officinalis]